MGWNPFNGDDWKALGGTLGGGFQSFGNLLGDGFKNGYNFVAAEGTTIQGALCDGALVAFKDAQGIVSYAIDFTKVTATSSAQWTSTAAGSVADFSLETYNEAKQLGYVLWQNLSSPATPPILGPEDPNARDVAQHLFSPAIVTLWQRDASAKGYTLALDFRMTFSCPPVSQTALTGIYVDSAGRWGFIGQTGTGPSLPQNTTSILEFWMVFGDRNDFQAKCYMPGLSFTTGPFTGGVNILLRPTGAFKGFRFKQEMGLLVPAGGRVAPDSGPPSTSLSVSALSAKGPAYSAASQVKNDSTAHEPSLISTAMWNTLPFVRKPGSWYFIQCKHSGKFLEIQDGRSDDGPVIWQQRFTGSPAQRFRFDDRGNGTFQIVNKCGSSNNKVLDLDHSYTDNGTGLIQFECHNGDNQRFELMAGDDGYFSLVMRHSGLALGIEAASANDGARLIQWSWAGRDHFKFRFIEVCEQKHWLWCCKCSSIFYGEDPSKTTCAAGGCHDGSQAGAGNTLLYYTGGQADGMLPQDHFRWCSKCQSLFFGGNPNSKCPKDGGLHDSQWSGNYVAPLGPQRNPYPMDDSFGCCSKCQGLVNRFVSLVCPAGGTHDTTQSSVYMLNGAY